VKGGTLVHFALALAVMVHAAGGASREARPAARVESPATTSGKASEMEIRMTVGGKALTGTLVDSETARDFASLLPLTVTLTDYAGTEKITDLPRRLSTKGAPEGSDPSVGDISYYAPWGNLALFYEDFGYSNGLITLGKLDSGVELLRGRDPVKVTIQLVK
jgi:hypothetical protein